MRQFFKRRWAHDRTKLSLSFVVLPSQAPDTKVTLGGPAPIRQSAGNGGCNGNILRTLVWKNGRIVRRIQSK